MTYFKVFAYLLCVVLVVSACTPPNPKIQVEDTSAQDQIKAEIELANQLALKQEFKNVALATKTLTYRANYDMTLIKDGKIASMKVVQYIKGDKFRVDTQLAGMELRNFITKNAVISCANENGWQCAKMESDEPLDPVGLKYYANESADFKVKKLPSRFLAETNATCYEIIPPEGNFEYCISPENVPLYVHTQASLKGTPIESTMTATKYSLKVLDTLFTPPAEPQLIK